MHSDDIHNTDIDNDKVPPNILHRDLFGVEISHEKKPLAIYDNAEATYEAQGDASEPTEHVGYFSGLINKILVRPVVLPKSNRTMHMSFSLMPGFDFRSGDAVLVELRIGSTTRKSEVISKDGHEAKQLDSSSGFHWSRVRLADASQGSRKERRASSSLVIRAMQTSPRIRPGPTALQSRSHPAPKTVTLCPVSSNRQLVRNKLPVAPSPAKNHPSQFASEMKRTFHSLKLLQAVTEPRSPPHRRQL